MTQPSGGAAGSVWSTQPKVTVQDANGNTVTGAINSITLTITSAGGATLTCTANPKSASSGVDTFAGCKINKAGTYTLTAAASGLTSAVSSNFIITAGSAASIDVNAGNNQSATAGSTVATLPSVIVKDSNGNPVSGAAVTFAVAPGGGSITG